MATAETGNDVLDKQQQPTATSTDIEGGNQATASTPSTHSEGDGNQFTEQAQEILDTLITEQAREISTSALTSPSGHLKQEGSVRTGADNDDDRNPFWWVKPPQPKPPRAK